MKGKQTMPFAHTTQNVLIVGAGPVGLTLANELFRHGVPCRLIDSSPHATRETKALGIMPRTLELLAKMGVAETAIARGIKTPVISPYSEGKRLARLDFREHLLDSPYPYPLMLPQNETEALLTEHLQSQDGAIEREVTLLSATQTDEGVETVLRHANGQEERYRADWLIGCDGAHSTVRHLLGFDFVGTTFEQSFAVGNVRLQWDLPYDELFAFVNRGNFIAYFPMIDGRHRVVIAYELEKVPSGDVTLEEIQHMIDLCGPVGARASEPTDLGRFHVNQRKAEHFAQGRIFLAGDAAHIHSIIGAQGMNTGMQDAFNLAWKLALVVKGQASTCLLASYESEREQVREALLRGTERATRMALSRNPLLITLRHQLAPLLLASLPGALHRLAEAVGEISIAYHHSPIVRDQRDKKGTLQAGDRAPDGMVCMQGKTEPQPLFEKLNSPQSILLVFTGQQDAGAIARQWHEVATLLSQGYGQMVDAYVVATQPHLSELELDASTLLQDFTGKLHWRYEAEQGGLLLIRPDGYIGFWGQFGVTEALHTYMQDLLRFYPVAR
jgi:2-polyprenyl-6-methoxyphenol hydroxylase-like FAD-dependent oxidoreductase